MQTSAALLGHKFQQLQRRFPSGRLGPRKPRRRREETNLQIRTLVDRISAELALQQKLRQTVARLLLLQCRKLLLVLSALLCQQSCRRPGLEARLLKLTQLSGCGSQHLVAKSHLELEHQIFPLLGQALPLLLLHLCQFALVLHALPGQKRLGSPGPQSLGLLLPQRLGQSLQPLRSQSSPELAKLAVGLDVSIAALLRNNRGIIVGSCWQLLLFWRRLEQLEVWRKDGASQKM